MTILDILDQISSTPARNEKEAILRKNIDNETLKKVFFLAYDPMTVFHIRKIPEYFVRKNDIPLLDLSQALDRLSVLSNREKTGHEGIAYLKNILECLFCDDALVLERVISKDLRIGCSDSTANKVWKELVPVWPSLLCSPFDQKLVDKLNWPCLVQLKLDSMRCNVVVKNGSVEFRSRNGKILDFGDHLKEEFLKMASGESLVFDGEVWVVSEDEINPEVRESSNGILLKSQKGTLSDKEAEKIRITLWDRIPYEFFVQGNYSVKYEERLDKLFEDFGNLYERNYSDKYDRIQIVPTFEVNNLEDTQRIFEDYLSEGLEGVILKSKDEIWKDYRSRKQIKFKAENTCDLICTGTYPGEKNTKYEKFLGGIKCESSDGLVKVSVGSGFSDKQRMEIKEEDIVGQIVEVMYNIRIKDKKTGQDSLFLPRFKNIRTDKDEADSSNLIK